MICAGPDLRNGSTLDYYDQDIEINARIDGAVSVQVDQDTNNVIINESLIFRPSEILFALDRCAYIDALWNLLEKESRESEPDDEESAN